jgi:exosortase/archaeosortase family protein
MRLVFPLLLVVYAFCFSLPLRSWVRATLILVSPLVAVACNILRLVPTVWLFGHASAETAQRFHDVSGWCMIGVAFLLLLGLIKVLDLMKIPVMVKGGKADTDA